MLVCLSAQNYSLYKLSGESDMKACIRVCCQSGIIVVQICFERLYKCKNVLSNISWHRRIAWKMASVKHFPKLLMFFGARQITSFFSLKLIFWVLPQCLIVHSRISSYVKLSIGIPLMFSNVYVGKKEGTRNGKVRQINCHCLVQTSHTWQVSRHLSALCWIPT